MLKLCSSAYYYEHLAPIKSAILGSVVQPSTQALIGVDFFMSAHKNYRMQIWQLPEQTRFSSLSVEYFRGASACVFFFDIMGNHFQYEYEIFQSYFNLVKEQQLDLPMILLGIGEGIVGDITGIEKFRQESGIEHFICLPWAKKAYQQNYIKEILCTIAEGNKQDINNINENYHQIKLDEQKELKKIINDMQEKAFSVIDILNKTNNIDYSDLPDLIQKPVLEINMKHLFYVGLIEYNLKIIKWLEKFPFHKLKDGIINIEDAVVNTTVSRHSTTLCRACQSGFLPAVQWLVQNLHSLEESDNSSDKYPHDSTPIIYAIRRQCSPVIRWLIEDLSLPSHLKNAALFEASRVGSKVLIEYLLSHGSEVDCKTSDCKTLLHFAAESGEEEAIEYLLACGLDVNCKTSDSKTSLHFAAESGKKKAIKCLLAHKANVNCKTNKGKTPLHFAAEKGKKEVVECLLDEGANINCKTSTGETPLYLAASHRFKELSWFLIERKAKTICTIKKELEYEKIDIISKYLQ